jgi:hypothetical protein
VGQSWFEGDRSGFAGAPAVDLPASWVVASIASTGSSRLPDLVVLERAFDLALAALASAVLALAVFALADRIHAGAAAGW